MSDSAVLNLTPEQQAELASQLRPMYAVHTTPQRVKAPNLLIYATQRNSKTKQVSEANRYRCIIVNEASLQVPAELVPGKFREALNGLLFDIAKDRLESEWQTNGDPKELPEELFTVDSLLAWNEQRAKGLDIDKASIAEWFVTTETHNSLNDAQRGVWKLVLGKLTVNAQYKNTVKPTEAAVIIGKLTEADSDTRIGMFVMRRCQDVIEAATAASDVSGAM